MRVVTAPVQARSRETRRRLLEAAIACLAERGWAGTTTTEVCTRAEVSQGALFKHFPTKVALIGAAIEELFASLVAAYPRRLPGATEADRIEAAVRRLWPIFRRPELAGAFELYTAARTDAVLHAVLEPVMLRHRSNLRAAARALFPEAAARNPRFEAIVDLVLSALQGASLGALAQRARASERAQLALLVDLVRNELEGAPCPS